MSQSVMISGAHSELLTQEPLCVSPGNCNHHYSADATSVSLLPQHVTVPHFIYWFPSHFWPTAPQLPFFFSHSHTNSPNLISEYCTSTMNLLLSCPAAWRGCCQCVQVTCGYFSFIILSKSGKALAQVDRVSAQHQVMIEFVLKWVLQAALLIQSSGPIRLDGLAFPPTCMLISLSTES